MRVVGRARVVAGVVVGLVGVSLLAGPASGFHPDRPPLPDLEPYWEEASVVLTLATDLLPELRPVIDSVDRIVRDPGGWFDGGVRGVHDFQRVCGGPQILVARFPDEAAAADAAVRLDALPGVEAQRNHLIRPLRHVDPGPDADRFDQQWGLRNVGQELGYYHYVGRAGEDIQAEPAWATGATGAGQVVAVLDEGVELTHPDLAPAIWTNQAEADGEPGVDDDNNGWTDDVHGWDYVGDDPHPKAERHGTAVSGVIVATDDGRGVRGVAPGAKLMPVAFIDPLDPRSPTELLALGAFAYAIGNGATIVNNSWGMYGPAGVGSPIMREAIRCAEEHDVVLAWSAGNMNAVPDWPQMYPSPVSIRSTSFDPQGCWYEYHQANPLVAEVMAPGTDVYTTDSGGGWVGMVGTSFASPHTAGVAALVRERFPRLSAAEVVAAVTAGARRTGFVEPHSTSWGFLSAIGALEAAESGAQPTLPGLEGEPTRGALWRCNAQPAVDAVDRLVQVVRDAAGL